MITIHHLNSSRSHRILWLLEELEVPYEIQTYQRGADLRAPPELKKIHPLGKSPVVTDSDAGVTMAESGAILEYLLDRFDPASRLRPPPSTAERWQYNYWLHYAEGSLMPQLFLALIFELLPKQPMPFFIKPIALKIASAVKQKTYGPELKTHFRFIEQHLSRSTYFAGTTFTAADIQMSYPLEAAMDRVEGLKSAPALQSYIQRLRARPSYQRAVARGGPLELPV
ncbi:MAG: glutathione S-transferase family protein [Bdellovibrionales bacterium]